MLKYRYINIKFLKYIQQYSLIIQNIQQIKYIINKIYNKYFIYILLFIYLYYYIYILLLLIIFIFKDLNLKEFKYIYLLLKINILNQIKKINKCRPLKSTRNLKKTILLGDFMNYFPNMTKLLLALQKMSVHYNFKKSEVFRIKQHFSYWKKCKKFKHIKYILQQQQKLIQNQIKNKNRQSLEKPYNLKLIPSQKMKNYDWFRQFGPEKPQLKILLEGNYLKNKIGYIFHNESISVLKPKIESFIVPAPARVGTIAQKDVFIPPGPTNMDPSQINFFHALQISTKIQKGQIEITKEVHVCVKGKKSETLKLLYLKK
ncbi:ribosomal phosphoprotein, putative [Ichthyophthirius multifiliis]|uniref:Ribosomal phosphoprotein, putative n=1 Tax=Ichthyophthirius multifiliis TaxID=5932 RepID=G0QNR4_ICHMU|nr:ribosomal phosphoprotein, putative [Ichthyophthirius multifiliis]EGR33144.1 ribosomal phosphoprotein, putative [Ichthyophthirius multifiliis]|eukprot:XP_004037130.1 ribosomal phosphoprotein, putative [Ichthyophthirius multifiliis]